jgi:hypothetical protein
MLLTAGLGLVAVGILAAWAARAVPGSWAAREGLGSAWSHGQFRGFVLIAVVCVVLLSVLVGWLLRHGLRRRMNAEAGTALIEFALILPIIMFIALVMIQSSLLMGGFVAVNYSSYAAARSAIVMIPAETSAEPRNVVVDTIGPGASAKVNRAWVAAIWPLLPTGDGGYDDTGDGSGVLTDGLEDLLAAYGGRLPDWAGNRLAGKLGYVQNHTEVTIQPPLNGDTYGDHEDIVVEVRHDLYLSIPYAARFFAAIDSDRGVDLGNGKHAVEVAVHCRLTNEGVQDDIEEETVD